MSAHAAVIVIYLVIINLTGTAICFADKRRAVRGLWRIRERTMFAVAAAGGSAGILAGMYLFRHKTMHRKFTVGIPLILICQIITAAVLSAAIVFY